MTIASVFCPFSKRKNSVILKIQQIIPKGGVEMKDISALCGQIVEMLHPEKVILFSRKIHLNGETSSFKLCVVADVADEREAQKQIYIGLDCDIPYDVVVYRPERFEELRENEGSFAQQIDRTGRVLYG